MRSSVVLLCRFDGADASLSGEWEVIEDHDDVSTLVAMSMSLFLQLDSATGPNETLDALPDADAVDRYGLRGTCPLGWSVLATCLCCLPWLVLLNWNHSTWSTCTATHTTPS